jgi:predicted phosphoribosyltransferase
MSKESFLDATDLNDEIFIDRQHAGKYLGNKLKELPPYADAPLLVAIGRGGIPVAAEAAKVLNISSVSALGCRKIPCNANRLVSMGVATAEGVVVMDDRMVRILDLRASVLEEKKLRAIKEARFDQVAFDAALPGSSPDFAGKEVILIDDGIATGMTALAAIWSMQRRGVSHVTLAAPVVSEDVLARLQKECDRICCSFKMKHILSIEDFYNDFPRVTLAMSTGILEAINHDGEQPRMCG